MGGEEFENLKYCPYDRPSLCDRKYPNRVLNASLDFGYPSESEISKH